MPSMSPFSFSATSGLRFLVGFAGGGGVVVGASIFTVDNDFDPSDDFFSDL